MGIGPAFAIPEVVKSAGLKLGDDNLFEIIEDYEDPFDVFEENGGNSRAPPLVRVENMFEEVQSKLPGAAKFLLCLLPERTNCDLYDPWKKKLADFGIVTQCIALVRVNDQYLTNVLLNINAKIETGDDEDDEDEEGPFDLSKTKEMRLVPSDPNQCHVQSWEIRSF
ncbi:protein argonaute 4B-like [Silene latifolia]|uniref:protein argonaute 4B-like n=1 Tax=Silene latifolia TaxID=37657 RepID=UPI003D771EFC